MSQSGVSNENSLSPPRLLRRQDQQLLAAAILFAAFFVSACWWSTGSFHPDLVSWECMPHHDYQFLVNVNTAAWSELMELPEIGETLARRIVAHRQAEGPFQSPEDLTAVHGIGVKTLEHMRPCLDPQSWVAAPESPVGSGRRTEP